MTYNSMVRLSKYVVIFILLSKATTNFEAKLCPIKKLSTKFEYFTNILHELKKKIILLIFFNLR